MASSTRSSWNPGRPIGMLRRPPRDRGGRYKCERKAGLAFAVAFVAAALHFRRALFFLRPAHYDASSPPWGSSNAIPSQEHSPSPAQLHRPILVFHYAVLRTQTSRVRKLEKRRVVGRDSAQTIHRASVRGPRLLRDARSFSRARLRPRSDEQPAPVYQKPEADNLARISKAVSGNALAKEIPRPRPQAARQCRRRRRIYLDESGSQGPLRGPLAISSFGFVRYGLEESHFARGILGARLECQGARLETEAAATKATTNARAKQPQLSKTRSAMTGQANQGARLKTEAAATKATANARAPLREARPFARARPRSGSSVGGIFCCSKLQQLQHGVCSLKQG